MNDLGKDETQLLTALREADSPTASDRERMRSRIWASVGLGVAGAGGAALSAQVAQAATTKSAFALGALTKWGAVVGLGAGVCYGTVRLVTTDTPPPAPASLSAAVATESRPLEQAAIAPKPPNGDADAEPAAPQVAPPTIAPAAAPKRPPSKRPATSSVANSSALDTELGLMREAQQALQSGHHSAALNKLAEHGRRFPRGLLASEREASTAIALCSSGQLAAGQTRAGRYLKAHPQAPLGTRVRAACKLP